MKLAILALLTLGLNAQTVLIGGGAQYNRYDSTAPAAQLFGTLALRVGSSPMFSFSTLELSSHVATVRTGGAYQAFQSGNTRLFALVDAGAQIGTVTLGTFSGGGAIVQQLGKSSFQLLGVLRMKAVNATSVKPVFEIGIFKAF